MAQAVPANKLGAKGTHEMDMTFASDMVGQKCVLNKVVQQAPLMGMVCAKHMVEEKPASTKAAQQGLETHQHSVWLMEETHALTLIAKKPSKERLRLA